MKQTKELKIGNRWIGMQHRPFVIAELSGNHNGSYQKAETIVRAAAAAGVDAIKLQTYTADTLTIDHHGGLFEIDDQESPWYGRNLYELYQEAYTILLYLIYQHLEKRMESWRCLLFA